MAKERNEEVGRKDSGDGKELHSGRSMLRMGAAVVVNKATDAESGTAPSPVTTTKDERSQPNLSFKKGTLKAVEAKPKSLNRDGDFAVGYHDEKDVASAAAEAASSKASTVAGSTLSQAAGT